MYQKSLIGTYNRTETFQFTTATIKKVLINNIKKKRYTKYQKTIDRH